MGLSRKLVVGGALVVLGWSYGCGSDGADSTATSGSGAGTSTATTSAVSTGTSTSTSTTSSSSSTGTGPIMCSSTYTTIPKGQCDLLQQDCAAGTYCRVVTQGGALTTACEADAGGLKEKGEECTTNTECKGGLSCVQDSDVSHCSPVCCPDNNEPCGTGQCDVEQHFDSDQSLYAFTCSYLPLCNLYAQDCKNGTECHLGDVSSCLWVCDHPASGHVDEGGACKYRNDCGDSQHCNQNGPDKGVCRYWCNPSDKNQPAGKGGCPMDRTCVVVNGTGCTDLGLCMPM